MRCRDQHAEMERPAQRMRPSSTGHTVLRQARGRSAADIACLRVAASGQRATNLNPILPTNQRHPWSRSDRATAVALPYSASVSGGSDRKTSATPPRSASNSTCAPEAQSANSTTPASPP